MSRHKQKRKAYQNVAAAASSVMLFVAGCQTAPTAKVPAAPAGIPSGTLVAFTQFTGYIYQNKQWEVLSASASHNTPTAPFKTLTFSPKGQLTASTVGSDDDSFMGNQIELWTYDNAWKQVEVNGDKTVAVYAWSPKNVLYAVPNDSKTTGIWYQSSQGWKVVPGSAALTFVNSVQFSPDGALTVTSQATDGSAIVSQYKNGTWQRLNSVHIPFAADGIQVAWSPSGVLTVATSGDGVWEDQNGTWRQAGGVKSPISDVAQVGWSPQGKLVISGDSKHARGIWALSNGAWDEIGGTHSAIAKDGIRQFAWSPSGVLTISDTSNGQMDQFESGKWVTIWTPKSKASIVPAQFGWSPSGVLTNNGGRAGGVWAYQHGTWSEIGGATSPLHGQPSIIFNWS